MDSTIIRQVSMTVMLVGSDDAAEKVASRLEGSDLGVLREGHVAAACERIAMAMPQVVVVLGALHTAEREALADRTTAVGALLLYVDAGLDDAGLDELVKRAAREAVTRKLLQDGEARAPVSASGASLVESTPTAKPPAAGAEELDIEVDVDSHW